MTDSAQVKSDEAFDGVDDHAQEEEGLDGHRVVDGHVVEEDPDGPEVHVRQQVREKRHDLKKVRKLLEQVNKSYRIKNK